jgi:hypothetical protein
MKNTKKLALACLLASAAQAAEAQDFSGSVGLSFGSSTVLSTDDDGDDQRNGRYSLDGQAAVAFNGWIASIDAMAMRRGIDGADFEDYAPSGVSAAGLHLGKSFGENYAGVFVGRNWFQGRSGGLNAYSSGTLYGAEGAFVAGEGVAFFGQIGRANMVGDPGDVAFQGGFYRLGVTVDLSEKASITVDMESGKSPNIFEDDGDEGDYKALTVSGSYAFTPSLIGTMSYSQMDITANTEDSGNDDMISVGLSIPFGTRSARQKLTTPYRPGLAAAWAATLD